MSLAVDHHAGPRVEAAGFGVAPVSPGLDLVDQETFDVANELAADPLPRRYAELAHNETVLEEVALLFDAPPDPFVLVVRVPAAFDGAAVGLAEVNNLIFVGMQSTTK